MLAYIFHFFKEPYIFSNSHKKRPSSTGSLAINTLPMEKYSLLPFYIILLHNLKATKKREETKGLKYHSELKNDNDMLHNLFRNSQIINILQLPLSYRRLFDFKASSIITQHVTEKVSPNQTYCAAL